MQFLALLYSQTRSAWLGVLISIFLLVIHFTISNPAAMRRWGIVVAASVMNFVLINFQGHNGNVSRARSIATDTGRIVTQNEPEYTGASRWYVWKSALPELKQKFWLGSGPDRILSHKCFNPALPDNKNIFTTVKLRMQTTIIFKLR